MSIMVEVLGLLCVWGAILAENKLVFSANFSGLSSEREALLVHRVNDAVLVGSEPALKFSVQPGADG